MAETSFLQAIGNSQNGELLLGPLGNVALATFTPSSATAGIKGVGTLMRGSPKASSTALVKTRRQSSLSSSDSDNSLLKSLKDSVKENPGTTIVVATAAVSGIVLLYKLWERSQEKEERDEEQVRRAQAPEW